MKSEKQDTRLQDFIVSDKFKAHRSCGGSVIIYPKDGRASYYNLGKLKGYDIKFVQDCQLPPSIHIAKRRDSKLRYIFRTEKEVIKK